MTTTPRYRINEKVLFIYQSVSEIAFRVVTIQEIVITTSGTRYKVKEGSMVYNENTIFAFDDGSLVTRLNNFILDTALWEEDEEEMEEAPKAKYPKSKSLEDAFDTETLEGK